MISGIEVVEFGVLQEPNFFNYVQFMVFMCAMSALNIVVSFTTFKFVFVTLTVKV